MDVIINNPASVAPFQGQVSTPMQAPFDGYGYGHHEHHGGGFGTFLLLLLGGVLLARGLKHKRWKRYRAARGDWNPREFFEQKAKGKNDPAVDIARERYARGEISLEALQVILKTLQ